MMKEEAVAAVAAPGTGECPAAASLKRELEPSAVVESAEPEVKKPRVDGLPEMPAVDLAQVKRQVEYYFSDDNLKYDKFFNPIIKESADGWLPMANILSCKRIQNLKVGQSDICLALKESALEIGEQNGLMCVRRLSPIPLLEERPPRPERRDGKFDRPANSKRGRVDDFHAAGCIVRISGLPCEAGWESIKMKMGERIPDKEKPQTPEEIAAGKKPYVERAIQFVSTPTALGECFALMGPFEGDRVAFASFAPLEVNGVEVKVDLVTDADQASDFVKLLPTLIKKRRERDILRKRKELNSKPIVVGTHEFVSIDHLRKCLKEVLNEFSPGKVVNQKTSKVLRGLLEFHPTGASKLRDVVDFKVDLVTHAGDKPGTQAQSRCFYVVRSDGTSEDFSLQKCFAALCQNPPFVQKDVATPKEATPKEATPKEAPAPEETAKQDAVEAKTEEQA